MNDFYQYCKLQANRMRPRSDTLVDFESCKIQGIKASRFDNSALNNLIFVCEGSGLSVRYNEFQPIQVPEQYFFFIPQSVEWRIETHSDVLLIVLAFDSLNELDHKDDFRIHTPDAIKTFIFKALPIRYPLEDYLRLQYDYIQEGIGPSEMYKLKFRELFLLLRCLYNKEEIDNLFHPLFSQSFSFKNRVIQCYPYVNNVDELVKKIGMSRANFDKKFKIEFGITPLQWMLKEKAKHIYFNLSDPDITFADIMDKYKFNSPTHLNRFCKHQFGYTPSELRKKLTSNG
jgi:AraC-like DNA-binding protein